MAGNLSTNYSVGVAKQDLAAVLKGSTLNQVQTANNAFYRAARQFLLDCDPQETIRMVQTPTLYYQVFDYPISNFPDLKGNKVIDIRPQVNRSAQDVFGQTYAQEFDVNKQYTVVPNFTTDFNTGQKSLRIDATDIQSLTTPIVLNNADGVSDNGTWTAGSNVTNITQNSINFVTPAQSSLQFNLSAGTNPTTGNIFNLTSTAVNLSAHENQSTLFFWVYLPTGSDFSSISLSWGSSASAYWTTTMTKNWQGNSFVNGWNLMGATWLSAVKTGSPSSSSITYQNVSFSYDGNAQTAVLLNDINSNLGCIFNIMYYSKYLFRDANTGVFQETVTDDSNLINLDTETFNVFFNLLAYYVIQQIGNGDAKDDLPFFQHEYQKSLARYQMLYKSQLTQPQLQYYATPKPSYSRLIGRGWWP